jgi:hypothetical protein
MMAPIELPATHKLLAVALNLPGNQTAITFNCAGKLVGSAIPSRPRKKVNCPNVLEMPPPIQATDHPMIPANITFFAPNLSTSQPDTGYITNSEYIQNEGIPFIPQMIFIFNDRFKYRHDLPVEIIEYDR